MTTAYQYPRRPRATGSPAAWLRFKSGTKAGGPAVRERSPSRAGFYCFVWQRSVSPIRRRACSLSSSLREYVHCVPMNDRSRRLLRGILVLAVLGATLGTALDAIHSHSGTTSYTRPFAYKAAWWVPLLFASAFAAAIARPLLDRGPRPATRQALLGMALFIAAYGLSAMPLPWEARAAILFAIFGVGWYTCDRSQVGLLVAYTAAVFGPTVEILLVRANAFIHHEPLVLGVPGWLPFLYLTAGPGLGTLAKWIVDEPSIHVSVA
jgi:hypothetical protein